MESVRVFIADSNFLIREGLKSILSKDEKIEVVAEADNSTDLVSSVVEVNPDVLLIDYQSPLFHLQDISIIKNVLPHCKIVAITELAERHSITKAMSDGIHGHILKDCDVEEILDSVKETAKGNQFYCGKILDTVQEGENGDPSCEPVVLSPREIEIIQQIASGLTNKEIADELCLSQHTVMTHRKKIMAKLGINNTAGLVIYAVKQNLISPNKFLFNS